MMHQPPRDYVPILPEPETPAPVWAFLVIIGACLAFWLALIWILWGAR